MFKNVAGQKLTVFAFDATTNLPKPGDAANITAYVDKDDAGVTVLADTTATEKDATNAKGYYIFDLAQAESNGDKLTFSAKSSTANIVVVAVPPVVYTLPPNFTALKLNQGRVQTDERIPASTVVNLTSGTWYTGGTAAQNWTALSSAWSAAVAGDEIRAGQGTYDAGTTVISAPANVRTRGAGIDLTILQSQVLSGSGNCMTAGNNAVLEDFTLQQNAASGNFQFGLGYYFGLNTVTTGVVVRRVKVTGDSDASYFRGFGAATWKHYDCIFASKWDAAIIATGTSGTVAEYYNCEFAPTGPTSIDAGAHDTRAVAAVNGIIRLFDCRLTPSGAGTGTNYPAYVSGSGRLEMTRCILQRPDGSASPDIYCDAGVVVERDCVYATTSITGTGTLLRPMRADYASEASVAGLVTGVNVVTWAGDAVGTDANSLPNVNVAAFNGYAAFADPDTGWPVVMLGATQTRYAPAKAGDAMTLTAGERTAINTTLAAAHGSGSWLTGSGGSGGGVGTGTGDTPVDHNTGGADNYRVTDLGGAGVDQAAISAYLTSDMAAGGTRTLRGQTLTGSDGRWVAPLMLNSGLAYTIIVTTPDFKSYSFAVTP